VSGYDLNSKAPRLLKVTVGTKIRIKAVMMYSKTNKLKVSSQEGFLERLATLVLSLSSPITALT
jgi:hypothetical protein